MIKLENVNKYFGKQHVLKDVNLEVKEGEKLVIIGPSGAGKSTLLKCINFLEKPTEGSVFIGGQELTARNKSKLVKETISMVPQPFALHSYKSVLDKLIGELTKYHPMSNEEAQELAFHYLEEIGLRDKAYVNPRTLPKEQRHRIAIVKALCAGKKIILFDEPISVLQPENTQKILDVINKLTRKNITVVIVTDEMGFARLVADRVVFLAEGRIIAEGNPEKFFSNPDNEYVKEFLERDRRQERKIEKVV